MGHQHLLVLPKSREWQAVVEIISGGANLVKIAAAVAQAAERSMIDASDDATARQSFYLLTQIPLAAKSQEFGKRLRGLGLQVGNQPTLVEIGTAMMDSIDRYAEARGQRTDYGEIAQLAAIECLQAVIGREMPDLFGAEVEKVRPTLAEFAEPRHFAVLARDFFSRLTRRHLNFYLSRELPAHVGGNRRFASIFDHEEFEKALVLHCRETSRIIKEFAQDWYFKHVSEDNLDPDIAGRFVHVAARKIRDELQQRRPIHA